MWTIKTNLNFKLIQQLYFQHNSIKLYYFENRFKNLLIKMNFMLLICFIKTISPKEITVLRDLRKRILRKVTSVETDYFFRHICSQKKKCEIKH